MRKHLFATMLLMAAVPAMGTFTAMASPEPQQQGQAVTTITGTVLDENNEPVIGASVVQKGVTGVGAATDAFGHFTLRVPLGAQLMVSYVGYKTVQVTAANNMTVYLEPTTEMLNEFVAIGYGSQKRANLTGAVATVDVARTMDSRPVQDVTRALQGAVPGLTITTTNGDFSSAPTIKIRGTGTLSNGANSAPLIVIDGVPVDDMSFLNPDDIAEISVLKDASSTAIYGTRAAFGVLLITTKGGENNGRVSVKYTNNFGWNSATDYAHFAKGTDIMDAALESVVRGFGGNELFGTYIWEYQPWLAKWEAQNPNFYTSAVELQPYQNEDNVGDYFIDSKGNWVRYAQWDTGKTLFQTAFSQQHNVSLDGTSGKTTYRASFGYDSKEGLMRYNPEQLRRYNATANISTEIFSWLKAGARFNFSQREYQSPDLQRNSYQYMWRFPSFFETYGYAYNDDGEKLYFRNEMGIRDVAHKDLTVSTQNRMQAWMNAEIIPGLTLQADFTYALYNMNSSAAQVPGTLWSNWTTKPFTTWNTYSSTYAAESNRRTTMWNTNIFATYAKTFNQKNNLKVMLGGTAERWERKYIYVKRTGLLDNSKPNIQLTDGDSYSTSGSFTRSATAGFFGRINYDYNGIYLLEVNGRYDGSSSFPAADQWAFFPSASAGYRFSEENYFAPLKSWWSNGKIRASYGHVGNEAIGDYMFLSTIDQTGKGSIHWLNNKGQKISEFSMPSLVSSSLTWERIITTDIGLDLGFFDNSLTFGFDWYQRDTHNMLAPGNALPAVLGANAPYTNAGQLRTRGWELSLGWNHSFGDADIYATFTLADARTKITKYNSASDLMYTYTYGFTEGMYYGDILGFETDRYFTIDDFTSQNADGSWNYQPGIADQSAMENFGNFHFGPGDVKYVDLNGDGVINAGNTKMIKFNGVNYVPGDEGYAQAEAALNAKDPHAAKVPAGSWENHGDLKVIGNALPRFEYGFRIGGAWKGFDLDMFFQGVGKRDMWQTGSMTIPMADGGSLYGVFDHQLDRNYPIINTTYEDGSSTPTYTIVGYEVNQDNTYPNMITGAGAQAGAFSNIGLGTANFYPQTRYLQNQAYLRFKNLTVGYTLPVEITSKALIQKARIYFSAENLCFLYNGSRKYHIDPELNQTYNGASNNGMGGFGRTMPMMRTLSFGVQVTF